MSPASSVFEWDDSQASVQCWLPEFPELDGVKWFIRSGNLLGNKPFLSFLPFPVFYSLTVLGTPVNKFACTSVLGLGLG